MSNLKTYLDGYFFPDVLTEALVTEEQGSLPDLKVLPVPQLHGVVMDPSGTPIEGAIVQMRHQGRADADPISESKAMDRSH